MTREGDAGPTTGRGQLRSHRGEARAREVSRPHSKNRRDFGMPRCASWLVLSAKPRENPTDHSPTQRGVNTEALRLSSCERLTAFRPASWRRHPSPQTRSIGLARSMWVLSSCEMASAPRLLQTALRSGVQEPSKPCGLGKWPACSIRSDGLRRHGEARNVWVGPLGTPGLRSGPY